jgi:hypothetical protein
MTIELLTIDHFSDKVGQDFVIDGSDSPPIALTLTEAKPMRNFGNVARAPFSLLFTTKGDFVLPQRMYALRHVTLGQQTIFLVPVGRDGESTTYQAIFN